MAIVRVVHAFDRVNVVNPPSFIFKLLRGVYKSWELHAHQSRTLLDTPMAP
jgi:hypothetical protein